MTVDISKARSLQAAVRLVAESAGMEWETGWSKAYKDRSPGGKVDIKLAHVRVKSKDTDKIQKALEKAFPTGNSIGVWDRSVTIYFDEDPGIGAKINDKAYQTRLNTLSKDIKALMITSGKSKTQVIKDLSAMLTLGS